MNYLLSAALVLLLAWPAYVLLVRYSDRYQLNRWLLLLSIVLIVGLPQLPLYSPTPEVSEVVQETLEYATTPTVPVINSPALAVESAVPNAVMETAGETLPLSSTELLPSPALTWFTGYLLGVGLMLVVLGIRMLTLLRLHLRSRLNGDASYRLLHPDASAGQAFTFGNNIYFSIDVPDQPDFDHVLAHERVHARQAHSLDVLLAELFLCAFWFHPTAWWLRTKLRANLEYLVDAEVVTAGTSRRDYQMALVRQSQIAQGLALALPFSEPTLKGRISRMTGLPQHRVVALMATGALVCWLGIAGLVVYGTAATEYREGEPFVEHYAEVLPDSIYAFDLYAKRVPTPHEYYQIRAMLKQIPGTELYLWKNIYRPGYIMELHHGSQKAEFQSYTIPEQATTTYSYRFGLVSEVWHDDFKEYFKPATGRFFPVAEAGLHNTLKPATTVYTPSKGFIDSPYNLAFNELAFQQELVIKVNGEIVQLLPPSIVETIDTGEKMFLFDNNSVAPVEWNVNEYFRPAMPSPEERMAKLLRCSDKEDCPRNIQSIYRPDQESALTWINYQFSNQTLPVRAYYNDLRVDKSFLEKTPVTPNTIISVGFRTGIGEPNYIAVHLIDDSPEHITGEQELE